MSLGAQGAELLPSGGHEGIQMDQALPRVFRKRLLYAPFPYAGEFADTGEDFFDAVDPGSGERCHTTRNGLRYGETLHYRDSTVFFCIPPGFNAQRPFFHTVFFHGMETTAEASLHSLELVDQVVRSKSNAVLIAPQLAVGAADSSPGKFFREGVFRLFMEEAARTLSAEIGGEHVDRLAAAPILLSAFSGGYKSAAYTLDRGGVDGRVRGVLLMDALYDDLEKFQSWILRDLQNAFFLLIYTAGSVAAHARGLAAFLKKRRIPVVRTWPARIRPGRVYLIRSRHDHFQVPLLGPPERPLEKMLRALDPHVMPRSS